MNKTITLPQSLSTWGSNQFNNTLKQELTLLSEYLPLQQALSFGNYVSDSPITIVINHTEEQIDYLLIRLDIIYQSIIAGCSCTDDPTPMSELNEICSLSLTINKKDAVAYWQLCK